MRPSPPSLIAGAPDAPSARRPRRLHASRAGIVVSLLLAACGGAAATATGTTPPPAATDTTIAARLSRTLDGAVRTTALRAASAAVVLADGREWRGASGLAEPGVTLTSDQRLGIGSVTKNMTAALLVRLAERGVLSLDDPLSRWIAPVAQVDGAITVRQLLNHTSGVFSITDNPVYRDSILADPAALWTPRRTLGLLRAPLFARGQGWSYSNSNYLLAGMVAEAAGGASLHALLRRELWQPLGLASPFLDAYDAPTGPLSAGWIGNTVNILAGPRTSTYSAAWGAGAVFATADDVARWLHALMTGRVVGAAALAQMMTPVGPEGYGLGMSRRTLSGRTVWGHTGEIRGYTAVVVHDPERRITVAVLCNMNPSNVVAVVVALLAESLR